MWSGVSGCAATARAAWCKQGRFILHGAGFRGCKSNRWRPPDTNDAERHSAGGVAQLGERLLCKQEVIGSIPFTSTNLRCAAAEVVLRSASARRRTGAVARSFGWRAI